MVRSNNPHQSDPTNRPPRGNPGDVRRHHDREARQPTKPPSRRNLRSATSSGSRETIQTTNYRPASIESSSTKITRPFHKPRVEVYFADNDFPAGEDRLGFVKSAKALCEMLERVAPPMSLAIKGPRGSGRSSYLQFIAQSLETSTKLIPIWIDAPSYNEQGAILPAIINQISREFGQSPEIIELTLRFITQFTYLREHTSFFDEQTYQGRDFELFRQQIEFSISASPSGMDAYLSVEQLQDTFLHFIQAALAQTTGRSFVVLVDDLDSCPRNKVLDFLKDMFCFTAIPGSRIIWAIPLDLDSLRNDLSQDSHEALLDKVLNLTVQVPRSQSIRTLVTQHSNTLGIHELKALSTPIADVAEELLITNPRIVKRVISRIGYCRAFGQFPRKQNEIELFICLAFLLEAYPAFFQIVDKDPHSAMLFFAATGSSYGNSNYSAMNIENMLKPMRHKFPKEVGEQPFQKVVGKIGTACAKIFGVRTNNAHEAVPRFARLLENIQQIF